MSSSLATSIGNGIATQPIKVPMKGHTPRTSSGDQSLSSSTRSSTSDLDSLYLRTPPKLFASLLEDTPTINIGRDQSTEFLVKEGVFDVAGNEQGQGGKVTQKGLKDVVEGKYGDKLKTTWPKAYMTKWPLAMTPLAQVTKAVVVAPPTQDTDGVCVSPKEARRIMSCPIEELFENETQLAVREAAHEFHRASVVDDCAAMVKAIESLPLRVQPQDVLNIFTGIYPHPEILAYAIKEVTTGHIARMWSDDIPKGTDWELIGDVFEDEVRYFLAGRPYTTPVFVGRAGIKGHKKVQEEKKGFKAFMGKWAKGMVAA